MYCSSLYRDTILILGWYTIWPRMFQVCWNYQYYNLVVYINRKWFKTYNLSLILYYLLCCHCTKSNILHSYIFYKLYVWSSLFPRLRKVSDLNVVIYQPHNQMNYSLCNIVYSSRSLWIHCIYSFINQSIHNSRNLSIWFSIGEN